MAKGKSKKSASKKKTKKSQVPQSRAVQRWALIVGVLAMLLYVNTLGHQWTLDDYSVIKENFVTQKGAAGIPIHFGNSYRYGYWNSQGTLYRPLSLAMFALEWQLAGDNAWLGHLMNVLLYGLTAYFLVVLLSKWLGRKNMLLALLAALFFVAHPIHTEVVANIKSRDEILAMLFGILSLLALFDFANQQTHARKSDANSNRLIVLALIAFTLALFSKESAITLLAIFPLSLFAFAKWNISDAVKTSSLFLIPTVLFLGIRYAVIGGVTIDSISILDNAIVGADGFGNQIATSFLYLGQYLKTLIIPFPLVHEMGYKHLGVTSFGDWRVWLSLIAYVGMGIYALLQWNKNKTIAFSILYFLITFSVGMNVLIQIGTSYAERLLFMPSLGFAIGFAYFLLKVFDVEMPSKLDLAPRALLSTSFTKYPVPLGIAGIILALYAFKTVDRNKAWYDSYTLYETDILTVPNSAKLNYHYGLELVQKAKKEIDENEKNAYMIDAVNSFNNAIAIYPSYGDAYAELGLAAYRQKDFAQAIKFYDISLQHKPNNSKTLSNKGVVYVEQGRLEEAKEVYKKAIQYNPRYVDALRNLGVVYAQTQNFNEALRYFLEALKYAPDDPTINRYIGQAYNDSGQPAKAQPYLRKANNQ